MELSAFTSELGIQSGRLRPSAADAGVFLDGAWFFVLGHDAPGFTAPMKNGDYVVVSQTADFTGIELVQFRPRTRPPAKPLPAGFAWTATASVTDSLSNTVSQSRVISGSMPLDWISWMLDLSPLTAGTMTIAFTLSLSGPTRVPPASPFDEIEVPGFYIELLSFAGSITPHLANAIPESGQGITTGSPPPDTTAIDFDIIGQGGPGVGPIDTTTINVTVGGVNAIVGGVVQLGWTGSITPGIYPNLSTHVTVQPVTPFLSGQSVTVAVTASTLGGTPLFGGTDGWSFAVADTLAPALLGATAQDTETVRLVWTEAVVNVTPVGAHDALNPSLYTFVPMIDVGGAVPAYTPKVVSVSHVGSIANAFDITTDVELTPGVQYQIAANGVADPSGNFAIAIALFAAFVPPPPKGRVFDLWKLIPRKNREEDATQDLARFVACLQEPASLLLYDIDLWSNLLDVDIATESFLDAMLQDLGNPFPFVLSIADKRRLVRLLVPIYQQKGTPDGIINTIRFFLGLTVTIVPYDGEGMQLGVSELGVDWILGPGTSFALYAFRVVSGIALTTDQRSKITFIANYMKPAHTHLISIVEPSTPPTYDPMVLGVSELGVDWLLH